MTATGRMFTNTGSGGDLYKIMQESPQLFGGVSVGAYADEYQMVNADGEPDQGEEAYFQITKGGLREVSVVMYPNNPMAEVQKLEYFRQDGSADLKVLEKALRDAGLSKQSAVAAASVFRQVLELRDTAKDVPDAPTPGEPEAEAAEAAILEALNERELLKQLNAKLKG